MTQKRKQRRNLPKMIAIAAAAAATLTISAFAAVKLLQYEDPSALLEASYGENVESNEERIVQEDEHGRLVMNLPAWERVPVDETLAQELLSPYIFAVGEQVSLDGYTLTAEAVLYDSQVKAGLLYYTVENADGADIEGYQVFPDREVSWTPEGEILTYMDCAGRSYMDTAMSTKAKLYICSCFVNDSPWSTADSIGLYMANQDIIKEEKISVQLPDGDGLADVEWKDGAVKLSPIAIRIDNSAFHVEPEQSIQQVILHYADGSDYVVDDKGAFVNNSTYAFQSQENLTTYTFNRIVDTSQITSVTVEGEVCERR